jgi:hypothetical protein
LSNSAVSGDVEAAADEDESIGVRVEGDEIVWAEGGSGAEGGGADGADGGDGEGGSADGGEIPVGRDASAVEFIDLGMFIRKQIVSPVFFVRFLLFFRGTLLLCTHNTHAVIFKAFEPFNKLDHLL